MLQFPRYSDDGAAATVLGRGVCNPESTGIPITYLDVSVLIYFTFRFLLHKLIC